VKPPAAREVEDEQDKARGWEQRGNDERERGKEDQERGIGEDAESLSSANMPSEGAGMPSEMHYRARRRGCWMAFSPEFFIFLPNQVHLANLLELLLENSSIGFLGDQKIVVYI
jgi:hypothetical protein